jgi:threonylcarbamoyladenosine tRNA methylthiotransferase MtaB
VKYSIVTFGCRVNQADSLGIERDLLARGAVATRAEEADMVVVNTCSVTASADQAARQTIRRIVRGNPCARVVVTGCYATRRPEELRELPNVVRVVSNTDKDHLVTLLDGDLLDLDGSHERSTADRFAEGDGPCGDQLAPGVAGRTALTLRVQTGCEERCSYCIIPTTRGSSRSRGMARVLADVDRAIAAGYKEIAITGVHLGSYGRDLGDGSSLTALIGLLAGVRHEVLFRISSLEPMDCTPEIVDLVAASPRLAPHFHLPLQHASDGILQAMRRPYTAADYLRLVERIRAAIPHASIGSDVIVGFPGETPAQFDEMRGVLRDAPLSHLHVFPYSDRPGTEASALPVKVDGAAIRDRGREVRAIGQEMSRRFRQSQAGTRRRALTLDDGRSAVTDNYIKVPLDQQHPRNEWVEVAL